MSFSKEWLNTGILIKCLQEDFMRGKNEYTISEHWWTISDIAKLKEMVEKDYLCLEGRTISFTEKGQRIINELYKDKTPIAIGSIYSEVKLQASVLLNTFR